MADSDGDFIYVYLDFNEKLTPSVFDNELFIRVAKLEKPEPVVQINDLVFKGSYDECIGSNLFFEEIEDPPLRTDIFQKETPIRLKHVLSQTKEIRLKQMKLPKKVLSTVQSIESVNLNLDQDYKAVLDKFEQGVLNIEDLAHKDEEVVTGRTFEENESVVLEPLPILATEPERAVDSYLGRLGDQSPTSLLEAKYERLKRLARRPVKRMKSPELVEKCEPRFKAAYEYHNLERQILQSSDAFRSLTGPIIEHNLVGGVDIDRCVLHGVVTPSNDPSRNVAREEREKVLTLDNFENLSLSARYLVLKECVAKIEDLIQNTSSAELEEVDENGRTVEDICEIFKKLVLALERHMYPTSESKKVATATETETEDNYVKYKYNPAEELVIDCPEVFKAERGETMDEEIGREEEIGGEEEIGREEEIGGEEEIGREEADSYSEYGAEADPLESDRERDDYDDSMDEDYSLPTP